MMARAHFDPDEEPEKYAELYKGLKEQCDQERKVIVGLGGLGIVGTERHESRRIDNQLRGRSGRQGDPGASQFYLSLEDDLLRIFGAESRVTIGIGLAVTREFAPLITGILVAGRSGSALAARLGTMNINQEIDALRVMGINPVRFLVAPSLFAMMVMVPTLTFWADMVGLFAAGVYVSIDLGISMQAYVDRCIEVLSVDDLMHGLSKSVIFAALITLVGVVNGAGVSGGAEGLGRATTRSVVQAISAIIVTDMIFVFVVTR